MISAIRIIKKITDKSCENMTTTFCRLVFVLFILAETCFAYEIPPPFVEVLTRGFRVSIPGQCVFAKTVTFSTIFAKTHVAFCVVPVRILILKHFDCVISEVIYSDLTYL